MQLTPEEENNLLKELFHDHDTGMEVFSQMNVNNNNSIQTISNPNQQVTQLLPLPGSAQCNGINIIMVSKE